MNLLKNKLYLTRLVKITAGRHHAWYETSLGFTVRKPIGQDIEEAYSPEEKAPADVVAANESKEILTPSPVRSTSISRQTI